MIRRRVIVSGRVQGVFFRDTVRRAAAERGVTGAVSNRDDGSLEAVFEGRAEAVDALVELCRAGPPNAEVRGVELIEERPEGLEGFRVS